MAASGTHARVVAIGPATQAALARHGVAAEVLPSFYSRDFAPHLGAWLDGKTIGIPRADVPNETLLDAIREAGGEPVEYRIYRLIPTGEPLDLAGADAVLFTSANSFSEAVWTPADGLLVCAIGEVTADRMRGAGVEPDAIGDGSLEGALQGDRRPMTALIDRPGIVVIDKPRGPSSHQVAAWVGEILGVPVGHAGTLDPMVSGVLVVMLGRAVRLARLLLRHEKEYVCLHATARRRRRRRRSGRSPPSSWGGSTSARPGARP